MALCERSIKFARADGKRLDRLAEIRQAGIEDATGRDPRD
jgi:hypothetical protein